MYVAFSLMYGLGLRISEACNARLSDLNFQQRSLLVRGKGHRERTHPVLKGLEEILQTYMRGVKPTVANGCDRRLVSYVDEPQRPGRLRKSFAGYAERAGIVGTRHVLRYPFATRVVRSGVSPFVLMKLVGHANVKTTMRYVHANGFDDLVAALDKMA